MVLVAERTFRFLKVSSILSFTLYIFTQTSIQLLASHPTGAPYYPHPVALSLFFVAQSLLQLFWLRKLCLSSHNPREGFVSFIADAENNPNSAELPPDEVIVESAQMSYIPFYVLGNALQACASILWMHEKFVGAQVFSITNVASQIYAVFILLHSSRRHSLSRKNLLTHMVAKTSAGLGMLYVWKGWGVIDNGLYPPNSELIQTSVIYLLLTIASGPDPTLGLCVIYNFLALAFGPGLSGVWRHAYMYDTGIIGMSVALDLLVATSTGVCIIRDDNSKPPPDYDDLEWEGDIKGPHVVN